MEEDINKPSKTIPIDLTAIEFENNFMDEKPSRDPSYAFVKNIKPIDYILYEDDDILVANKPPFITSEMDNQFGVKSFADHLKKYNPDLMLCHRLDKETSGCIIAAKNKEAYRHISIGFEERQIGKLYQCLLKGAFHVDEKIIELPIHKVASYRSTIDKKKGKEAQTIIKSIKTWRHYTLMGAQPITGRFHQIRVHLEAVGTPILGDQLYGGESFYLSSVKKKFKTGKYKEEETFLNRTALHSRKVEFQALNGTDLSIEAPYPKDMGTIIELLDRYDV